MKVLLCCAARESVCVSSLVIPIYPPQAPPPLHFSVLYYSCTPVRMHARTHRCTWDSRCSGRSSPCDWLSGMYWDHDYYCQLLNYSKPRKWQRPAAGGRHTHTHTSLPQFLFPSFLHVFFEKEPNCPWGQWRHLKVPVCLTIGRFLVWVMWGTRGEQ